jgi:O-antigen/teichoic acid export membrane protein
MKTAPTPSEAQAEARIEAREELAVVAPISILPSDDHGVARGVVVSASSQVGVQVVHMVLNVVSSLVIIRYLPPETYGDYVLVMTMMTVIGLLADFGLNKLGVRDVAADGTGEDQVVGTIIGLRLLLAAIAAVLFQVVLSVLGRSAEVHLAAALASLTFVASAILSITISFEARLQQHISAFTLLVGELVETSLVVWLVRHDGTIAQLYGAVAIGMGAAALVAIVFYRRRIALRPRFATARVKPLIKGALPIASASLVGILLVKLDALVLVVLRPTDEVGLYGAAYAPIEYLAVAAVVLANVLLPVLSHYHVTDRGRFLAAYRLGAEALAALVVPMAVAIACLARPAVELVYSSRYEGAIVPMQLLGAALVTISFCAWFAIVLLAVGEERRIFRYNGVMLGIGLLIQPPVIAWLGVTGAAIGVATIGLLTASWAAHLVQHTTGATLRVSRLVRIAVANGVLALIILGLSHLGLDIWLAALVGAVAYLPLLLLLGVAPRDLASLLAERDEAKAEEALA